MDFVRKLMNDKKFLQVVSMVLVVAIALTTVAGIFINIVDGDKYDADKAVETFAEAPADFSSYFTGMSEETLKVRLDYIEAQILTLMGEVNIPELIYSDAVATMVASLTADLTGKALADVKFKTMKKEFPDAYAYVTGLQEQGKTWADIGTIPFGIEKGDKEAFIKACGAGAQHFGDTLFKVIMKAPSAYYDVLLPILEALHVGEMPSMSEFVRKTGLSGSKRVEFLAEQLLKIMDPLAEAPLTYLCDIVPDLAKSYTGAVNFLAEKPKVAEKTGLSLPAVDGLITKLMTSLAVVGAPFNADEVAKMGTAEVTESAGNNGERMTIYGKREVVFAFLSNYLLGTLVHENNFAAVSKLIHIDMKSDAVQQFADVLARKDVRDLIADITDVASKLKGRQAPDVQANVTAYNNEAKDFSNLFTTIATRETVGAAITALDMSIVATLSDFNLDGVLFSDEFATTIAKLTAELCGKQPADLAFGAMKKSFPQAYSYMMEIKSAGKTWDDVDVIPFGIAAGDKAMFIKACGAGAEHFGDTMTLCLLASPTCYEEVLMPLFESLHTGAMPDLQDFVGSAGLDGAKRMEEVTEKVLSIVDPLMAAPLSYLLEILPDFVSSYNKAQAFVAADANLSTKAGLNLPVLKDLLNNILGDLGMTLPEYDFAQLEKMGTASVAASGDYNGERMEITGDKEAVFMAIAGLIKDFLTADGNISAMTTLLGDELGIDLSIIDTIVSTITSLDIAGTIGGAVDSVGGMLGGLTGGEGGGDILGGITDAIGGIVGGIGGGDAAATAATPDTGAAVAA